MVFYTIEGMEDVIEKLDKYEKVIFDFDETLFWLKVPWMEEYPKQLREVVSNVEVWRRFDEGKILNLNNLQNELVREGGEGVWREIVNFNRRFEREELVGVEENVELVEWLRKTEKKFYLWTANTRETVEKILLEKGLLDKFEKLVTRDEVVLIKPEVEGFALIAESAEGFVMAGDAETDREVCEKLRMEFVQVRYFLRNW